MKRTLFNLVYWRIPELIRCARCTTIQNRR